MARIHRDQLVAADQVLARFPIEGDDAGYLALQQDLARVAPTVQDSAWGHMRGVNYFCRLATTISAGEGLANESAVDRGGLG